MTLEIIKVALKTKKLNYYTFDVDYVRAASIARKIYLRGGLGVGAFQRIYGGSQRNGSRPPHFCKSSGSIARHILQQFSSCSCYYASVCFIYIVIRICLEIVSASSLCIMFLTLVFFVSQWQEDHFQRKEGFGPSCWTYCYCSLICKLLLG
ncbi:40S ribosomal protein S19-2 [Medicago truncatula]|uniref:40S ribosomal protein S19-2 n=1 Tax=Medicago truncatula TaxID=3880 RepID=UPI0019689B8C|nr:40S ribosomal protein S19-2-like [Medicago truncatula]